MRASQIVAFFHCVQCVHEKPLGVSPREWAKIEVGWTKRGFQVWCLRHHTNIIHMDFEGMQHVADTSNDGTFSEPTTRTHGRH